MSPFHLRQSPVHCLHGMMYSDIRLTRYIPYSWSHMPCIDCILVLSRVDRITGNLPKLDLHITHSLGNMPGSGLHEDRIHHDNLSTSHRPSKSCSLESTLRALYTRTLSSIPHNRRCSTHRIQRSARSRHILSWLGHSNHCIANHTHQYIYYNQTLRNQPHNHTSYLAE